MVNIALTPFSPAASGSLAPAPGPLAFQLEIPAGIRYHVSGKGFVAKRLQDATRHTASPDWTTVPIDPFYTKGGHYTCFAVLDITSVEETVIRAKWGTLQLALSPTNFHAEASAIVRPLLGSVVRTGGTPFGPAVYITDQHKSVKRGTIFNIGFLLPPDRDELLQPLSPFGAGTPREILCRIHLLGFTFHDRTFPESFSIWRKRIPHATLQLITGFACEPTSICLLNHASEPILTRQVSRSYTELHPLLVSFIAAAKTAYSRDETTALFAAIFC